MDRIIRIRPRAANEQIEKLEEEIHRLKPYESVAKSSQRMLFEMSARIEKLEAVRVAAIEIREKKMIGKAPVFAKMMEALAALEPQDEK